MNRSERGVERNQRRFIRSRAAGLTLFIAAAAPIVLYEAHHYLGLNPFGIFGTPKPSASAPSFGVECPKPINAADQSPTSADFPIRVGNKTIKVGLGRSVDASWYREDNPHGTRYPEVDGTVPNIPIRGRHYTMVFGSPDKLCKQP